MILLTYPSISEPKQMAPKCEQATNEPQVPENGSNTKSLGPIYAWLAMRNAMSCANDVGPK